MTTSPVAICNRALDSIGARATIASLTEQSTEAKACNRIYEATRDEVLSMAFWNFARKTASGNLIKSAPGTPTNNSAPSDVWLPSYPAPPWLYEYAYPSDCLQVRMLQPQPQNGYIGGVPLQTANLGLYSAPVLGAAFPPIGFMCAIDTNENDEDINVVLTNQYQAILVYTRRVTNPNVWSSQFVQAMVAAMAAKLAQTLTGNLSLANQKFVEANGWVVQARASDGNEGLTVIDNMPDWITIREDWGGAFMGYYIAPYGALFSVY